VTAGTLPADDRVFLALVDAARRGHQCPTNAQLAATMGWTSTARASEAVSRLEHVGRIKVTRYQSDRVVEIPGMALRTAAPPGGRKPRCHQSRGQWPADRVAKLRECVKARMSIEATARALGTTVLAVRAKAQKLGVSFAYLRDVPRAASARQAPMPREAKVWTAARIDRLRDAAKAGIGPEVVAREYGCSRKAVIAAAKRHGIDLAPGLPVAAIARLAATNPPQPQGRHAPPSPPVFTDPAGTERRVPAMNMPAPANPRSFVSLFTACQWVIGDPRDGATKCGDPTAPGRPYCQHHTDRAYVQPGDRHPDGRRIGAIKDRMGLAS
jgi:hypothetical protein